MPFREELARKQNLNTTTQSHLEKDRLRLLAQHQSYKHHTTTHFTLDLQDCRNKYECNLRAPTPQQYIHFQ